MSISILIVTYNSTNQISTLIESIKQQKFQRGIQIIIVDNNSIDQQILRKLVNSFKESMNIKLVCRTKNYGFGSSINFAAKYAKYKQLLLINPDSKLMPSSIDNLVKHYKLLQADIIGGKATSFDQKIVHDTCYKTPDAKTLLYEFTNIRKIFNIKRDFFYKKNELRNDREVEGLSANYLMVKKSTFEALNGFDESFFMYLEDVDFCARAKSLGYKIYYCPHSIIFHIAGASSNNKYRINEHAWFNSRKIYARKYLPRNQALFMVLIYTLEQHLLKIHKYL